MRSLLRPVALACIVASALPQVVIASDALHVLLHHAEEHGHAVPVDSIEAALHGHVHSAGTPDHDHPLTKPLSGNVATDARGTLQPGLPIRCVATCGACALANVSLDAARSATQRPTATAPTILRI